MSTSLDKTAELITDDAILTEGKRVIRLEREALATLESSLDSSMGREFLKAVSMVEDCQGKLVFSGMGKAGLVAQKVAATFSSLGKASFFMHPGEAAHGDLGMVSTLDTVIFFSNSGETEEIVAILKSIQQIEAKIIAITATRESTLARESQVVLTLGKVKEACSMGLAPTTSTTLMLAIGDALAVAYLKKQNTFNERSFAFYHPRGSLGKRYTVVSDVMRVGKSLVVVNVDETVQSILMKITKARVGSAVICDEAGKVIGIFSDGDLRRALQGGGEILNQPIENFMSHDPTVIDGGEYTEKAKEIMKGYKIGEIPVVDKYGIFVGLLSLRDIA